MEIKARYRLIGLFMLFVIGMGFVFVYWLQNAGGLTERKTYKIRFTDTVGGLLAGAPVQFNGMRVGEVTDVVIDRNDPHLIMVTIGIDKTTPLRRDTSVRIDFQGLTGSAAIALSGGSPDLPKLNEMANPPELVAGASAGQGLSDMAREVLGRLDKIFSDNSSDLHDTIANFKSFSGALAKNSDKIDTILSGLEKTFAAPTKAPIPIFDLTAPHDFPPLTQPPHGQLVVADLTTILLFDTQRLLLRTVSGETRTIEDGQWSDSLPRLIQERLVQTFENAHYIGSVSRSVEGLNADYQLLVDLRTFAIVQAPEPHAEVEFAAKLLAKDGVIAGGRLFEASVPVKTVDAVAAAAALGQAFTKTASDVVPWAAGIAFGGKPR